MTIGRKTYIFICEDCGNEYAEDEEDDIGCCNVKKEKRYRCEECDEVYEDRNEAISCCKEVKE